MFERYSDRARKVITLAQEEARKLNHNYIGTEHLLLGMLSEGEGVAALALKALDISLEAVRIEVIGILGKGAHGSDGHLPFTPPAKKALECALREALQLGHNYIGTEHLLLGLLREGEGVAAQTLIRLGANLNRARQQVIQLLTGYNMSSAAPSIREINRAAGVIAESSRTFELLERLHKIAMSLGGISLAEAADKVLRVYESHSDT